MLGQDMKILSSNSFITHPVSFSSSIFLFLSLSLSMRDSLRVTEREGESFSLSQFSSIFPSRMKELYSFPANVVNPREGDFLSLQERSERKNSRREREKKFEKKRERGM